MACIFTDGASEGCVNTVGGVAYLSGRPPRFFSCAVPDSLVKEWCHSLDHMIGPVEAYAVVLARSVWHQFLAGSRCIFFIDNFAVLDAFIKGYSQSRHFVQALCAFETKECLGRTWPWFSRVPSDSNVADSPSRGDFQHLLELGFVRDSCLCPFTSVDVKNLCAR